jgi:hypothetical protein
LSFYFETLTGIEIIYGAHYWKCIRPYRNTPIIQRAQNAKRIPNIIKIPFGFPDESSFWVSTILESFQKINATTEPTTRIGTPKKEESRHIVLKYVSQIASEKWTHAVRQISIAIHKTIRDKQISPTRNFDRWVLKYDANNPKMRQNTAAPKSPHEYDGKRNIEISAKQKNPNTTISKITSEPIFFIYKDYIILPSRSAYFPIIFLTPAISLKNSKKSFGSGNVRHPAMFS